MRRLTAQQSLPGSTTTAKPFQKPNRGRSPPGVFIHEPSDIPPEIAPLSCFELIVSQFNDLGLALEFSHGFEVSELCLGCCPLDSFKVTALLVNPATRHWCKAREVLVSNW